MDGWIIKNGIITNVSGDGIRVEGARSGGVIMGNVISNVGGSGIVIGAGAPLVREDTLEVRLQKIEKLLHELPQTFQAEARELLQEVRKNPTTSTAKKCFQAIYEVAIRVSSSSIASVVADLVTGTGHHQLKP